MQQFVIGAGKKRPVENKERRSKAEKMMISTQNMASLRLAIPTPMFPTTVCGL